VSPDAYRRHRRARRRSVDRERPNRAAFSDRSSLDLMSRLLDRELTPASAAVRREIAQRFRQAVSALNDDDREVIRMRYFEQLSNQDVAAELGLTEAAASMRHLRALRRLRSLLDAG
jgi:RNA polymerase sigma-70 factor (ECF subfamily)